MPHGTSCSVLPGIAWGLIFELEQRSDAVLGMSVEPELRISKLHVPVRIELKVGWQEVLSYLNHHGITTT